ncbi:carbohydrate ABC transporter permease [Vallitalea okinawensis]|uniref:carbohydrate ABC transporter permease n=1 Tax=Vallitalea okinawensis TaxID=2078660 RepID=UPI000CFB92C6|nr:carbohydrate ABC transporter permease [Vallitalea okinawensis]
MNKYTYRTLILEVFAILVALLFLAPFYFVINNSFKTFADILIDPASLAVNPTLNNYTTAWEVINFPSAFFNSIVITVFSNIGLVLISSLAAYRLLRYPSKINGIIFGLFIAAMVIPFQSIMIPLVRVTSALGFANSRLGLIFSYFGFGVSLPIFLYHGFIKSIPKSIEESAIVDGCSTYGVFGRIVAPLLKPMTATVLILNTLWIWNDFLLPSLILHDKELKTIPLAVSGFFAQYTKKWDLALAALVLAILPIVIFFLSLQKFIIRGIVAGSVKG